MIRPRVKSSTCRSLTRSAFSFSTRRPENVRQSCFWNGSSVQFPHNKTTSHPPSRHQDDDQRHFVFCRMQRIGLLQLGFVWHHGLQHQPSTARAKLVCSHRLSCSVQFKSRSQYWLLIISWINCKVAVLTHEVRPHYQSTYLSSVIVDYILIRSLRSQSTVTFSSN